jgi:ubiquinone/menaquinone biosynthesis C-methylase UbiE
MHSFAHSHYRAADSSSAPQTHGMVLNWPSWFYDLTARFGLRLMMGVSRKALLQRVVSLAELQPGESVLDVGCGTGSLAIVAKKRVGAAGRVCGIDPSASLLAGARRKAARRNLAIDFQRGVIEQLPFPDQSFDATLSTIMMHHLPDDIKRQGLIEIARVLKPGGRLLIADFKRPEERQGQPVKFGAGMLGIQDLPALMQEAGFSLVETGETRFRGIGFALGKTSLA